MKARLRRREASKAERERRKGGQGMMLAPFPGSVRSVDGPARRPAGGSGKRGGPASSGNAINRAPRNRRTLSHLGRAEEQRGAERNPTDRHPPRDPCGRPCAALHGDHGADAHPQQRERRSRSQHLLRRLYAGQRRSQPSADVFLQWRSGLRVDLAAYRRDRPAPREDAAGRQHASAAF